VRGVEQGMASRARVSDFNIYRGWIAALLQSWGI